MFIFLLLKVLFSCFLKTIKTTVTRDDNIFTFKIQV